MKGQKDKTGEATWLGGKVLEKVSRSDIETGIV